MSPAHSETNDDELLRLATLVNQPDLPAAERDALERDIAALDLGCVETLCRKCRSVAVLVGWRWGAFFRFG